MRMNMLKYIFVFAMITLAVTPMYASIANNLDCYPPKCEIVKPGVPWPGTPWPASKISGKNEVIVRAMDDRFVWPPMIVYILFIAEKNPIPWPSAQDPTPQPFFIMTQISSIYYKFTWNTFAYSNGNYIIYVKAIDAAGNIGYAAPYIVCVMN